MSSIKTILLGAACVVSAAAQSVVITTTALPAGTVGANYSATLTATGGATPYTWSGAGLPPGLVMSSLGTITGTPTTAGSYLATISLRDLVGIFASKQLSISISPARVSVNTTSLPNATVGQNYNQILTAINGTPPYKWTAGQGFPAFWTLNATTGAITGIPTVFGPLTFTVQVTDATNTSAAATFSLTINPAPLVITTIAPLFNGIVGTAYSQTFSASGGITPYTWAILSGTTGGLTLDPVTGILQGTPQNTGTFPFVIQVTDKAGTAVSQSFSVIVNPPNLTITVTGSAPAGAVGVAYTQKLPVVASGGTPPYSWALINGAIPGLTFDSAAVSLSGTPTTAGTFNFTIQVSDSAGLTSSRSMSLMIAPPSLSITTARQLPDTPFNAAFSQVIEAVGGSKPYTWSATGLPAGLSIDANSGVISGTANAAGSFSFAVIVTDSALKQASDRFSINITLPRTPAATMSGIAATVGAAQQFPLQIELGSSFPVAITGQAFLSFAPDLGPVDRTIQWASGGTVATFTIPAGSTTAVSDTPLAIQTGTVSGTLTITLRLSAGVSDITPSPTPTITAQIARSAPNVSNVQVNRGSNNISVVITGYSTARELTQMVFNFSAAAGQSLQSSASSITVPTDATFTSWYQDPVNGQYGSQFVFTQPFTVQGDPNQVTLASVVLTNRSGSTTVNVGK